MANEYLRDFAVATHQKLRERVVGRIRYSINEETDSIRISILGFLDFEFVYVLYNIGDMISKHNWSSDDASRIIISEYKKAVERRYFKESNNEELW